MRLRGKLSARTILAALCLLSALGLLLPAEYARWPGRRLFPWLRPLGEAGMLLASEGRSRIDGLTGDGGEKALAERTMVYAMADALTARQRRIEELQSWRKNLPDEFYCRLIDARIVAVSGMPLRNRAQVNVGDDRAVRPGDLVTTRRLVHRLEVSLPPNLAVLGRNHVVGAITDCSAHGARLQFVIDSGFSMGARLLRMVPPGGRRVIRTDQGPQAHRHDGVTGGPHPVGPSVPVRAEGDGRQIVLRHVPAELDIMPGDYLASDPDTALLPFGIGIGNVERTEHEAENAHFVTVYVRPLADLDALRNVYIVLPLSRREE